MENPIKASLSILPHEKLIEILLALDDLEDIFNACSSSTIFARVCQNDYFWKLRYQQDFGSGHLPEGITWKKFYKLTHEILHFLPLSAGNDHLGVIDQKGQLNMWGDNSEGQLGNGSEISTSVPQIVLRDVRQVSCGYDTTGAVTKDGKVYTWGSNYWGGLGIGHSDKENELIPTLVRLPKKVRKIDNSFLSSIVLTEDGEVYMWGKLTHHMYTVVPIKLNLPPNEKAVDVAIGEAVSAAITKSGKLYMWGDNRHYLYLSKNWINSNSEIYNLNDHDHRKFVRPTLIPFYEPIRQISMGEDHLGAVTKKGELWMMGSNDFDQIGEHASIKKDVDGYKKLVEKSIKKGIHLMSRLEKNVPSLILIKMPSPVLYFNSRWRTSSVKLKDGRVLMWGDNKNGQIGSYKQQTKDVDEISISGTEITKPVEIILDRPIVYITSGGEFTTAITDDDYINLWRKDLPYWIKYN